MLAVREGLGLGVGVQVVDDGRLDVLVRLAALLCLEAVGHTVVNSRTTYSALRVLAAFAALR